MTAISSYSSFASLLASADVLSTMKTGSSSSSSILGSFWTLQQLPGATPTTSVALNASSAGAINAVKDITSASGSIYLGKVKASNQNAAANPAVYIIADRLNNSGGLDATSTSAQTTNLPTAALTRYTSGAGVFAALEIYTAIGTSGTTAQISYTNSSSVSGRTSKPFEFGITNYSGATRTIICPLQDGDVGVQAVASVTLAQSSGTVGNFGVTLFKPLFMFIGDTSHIPYVATMVPPLGGAWQFSPIVNGACLYILCSGSGSVTGASFDMNFIKAT